MLNINPKDKNKIEDFAYVLDSFYLWTDLKDQHVGRACREYGVWESDLTEWMIRNIKPGSKCLDIGFNIGYYTEVLSRIVGPEGEVWAFEPNIELINNYNEARKLNDYTNCSPITIYPVGLSNRTEQIKLMGPNDNIGGSGITNESVAPDGFFIKEVVIKRLDEIFNKEVDFIKIDVEGHEPEAFEGFPESVLNCPLIVAELGPYHPESFLRGLEEKYYMETLNYVNINTDIIMAHPHHLNVVLRKK